MVIPPSQQPVKNSLSSLWVLNTGTRRASGTSETIYKSVRRNSKTDTCGTSTWQRQQLLGQPPTRRAYHSAHRVLVGGMERIVIYGGEIGNTLSRPSSQGSNRSTRSNRSNDEDRRKDHPQRINDRLALLATKSPTSRTNEMSSSPVNVDTPPFDGRESGRASLNSINSPITDTRDLTSSRRNFLNSLGSACSDFSEKSDKNHFSFTEDDITRSTVKVRGGA